MFGETGAALAQGIVVVAHIAFAVAGIVLAAIDLREHRLPDRIVLPLLGASAVAFLVAAVLGADLGSWVQALLGSAVLGGFYFVLRVANPAGMGGGDVKLAAVIGLYLGRDGWMTLAVGALAAFVLGAFAALALIALRRARGSTRIPFGPWMLAGASIGLIAV